MMRKATAIHRSAGVSLAELLVVLAIIALAIMVAVPRINVAIKSARIRTVADQLTITLQAARMIAVSRQQPCFVTIGADPANFYTYVDSKGKNRHIELPHGVRILNTSSPLVFRPNGSIAAATTTTIETEIARGVLETWDIRTNILGVSTATRRERS